MKGQARDIKTKRRSAPGVASVCGERKIGEKTGGFCSGWERKGELCKQGRGRGQPHVGRKMGGSQNGEEGGRKGFLKKKASSERKEQIVVPRGKPGCGGKNLEAAVLK